MVVNSKQAEVVTNCDHLPIMGNEELIARRILFIRDQRVMLDADLAELYGVPTKALNQAVIVFKQTPYALDV